MGNSRTRGFTLIEMMVALAISTLLLMGVVALFISSRASYETTEQLSRIQENGRFSLDQFATDIRSAGFQGCARGTTPSRMQDFRISTVVDEKAANPDMRWNFVVPAQGYNANSGSWLPTLASGWLKPEPNSIGDVLVLRIPRREVRAVELTTKQATPTDPLVVSKVVPMPLAAGDTAVISDCEARAFFQVTSYNSATGELAHAKVDPVTSGAVQTPGNDNASLDHPFNPGARVLPITTMVYYLAPSANDASRMSLWRKTGGAENSDEIAEGIDRLEVRYGIDSNGDSRVDSYVEADGVTNWDAVLTVQVALLARAPEAYGTDLDKQTYVLFPAFAPLPAVQAGPYNDRNQRKIFTATLAVRNQIFD
jgi:type IV pilus assembly protein PilW